MTAQPSRQLETFPNPNPDRDFVVHWDFPEYTSVCPKTGQPDFGAIRITYIPDKLCLEMKSLKLYFWSYRDQGVFYEAATNQILDDLVAACQPRWMRVVGDFTVRGGMSTRVTVEHRQPGWSGDIAAATAGAAGDESTPVGD